MFFFFFVQVISSSYKCADTKPNWKLPVLKGLQVGIDANTKSDQWDAFLFTQHVRHIRPEMIIYNLFFPFANLKENTIPALLLSISNLRS